MPLLLTVSDQIIDRCPMTVYKDFTVCCCPTTRLAVYLQQLSLRLLLCLFSRSCLYGKGEGTRFFYPPKAVFPETTFVFHVYSPGALYHLR